MEKVNRFQEQYDKMEKRVNNEIEEKVNKINLENNLNINSDNFPKLKNVKVSKNIIPNPNKLLEETQDKIINTIVDSDNYNLDDDELVDEEIVHKPFKSVSIKSKEEVIGEIIGLLQSPAKRVIAALLNNAEQKGEAAE